ncbi:glucuronate isomerase [Leifsonia kafniensis]|uniref:Uronate isomerase n=2 Tax=Leifsonia kafniensis TaxID=475957 RepID=A0ABP7KDA0_9MICO
MKLQLDPDRLFPADPATRDVASGLYSRVADLPILSPHGHVDPALLLDNTPFGDPSELFIRYDHYVTRLMHAAGVQLSDLGIPDRTTGAAVATPREVWRTFCAHWYLYAGTASGYWLQHAFVEQFGIDLHPSIDNADALFDRIDAALATDAFRPRALFSQFGIEVLATTDDPMDDLATHRALAEDPSFAGRVLPTFRPDAYLNPAAAGWADNVHRLAEWNGSAASSYSGYIDALAGRRRHFVEHGAVSADHGVFQPLAVDLDPSAAAALFDRALAGTLSDDEQRAFAGHMLLEMARMSVDDGLVMTVHPGVLRNHHTDTFTRFGPDTGHDIPATTTYVDSIRPLLQKYGTIPDFHLVLFAVDESVYSREVAPLAGFYPSVYVGAPWWFLDAPDAVLRFRSAVTETAGFYRSSGFIDDTRAFLSIPARHDMARRLDSAFLARLVREGRIDTPTAERIIVDLVDAMPRKVFKL